MRALRTLAATTVIVAVLATAGCSAPKTEREHFVEVCTESSNLLRERGELKGHKSKTLEEVCKELEASYSDEKISSGTKEFQAIIDGS